MPHSMPHVQSNCCTYKRRHEMQQLKECLKKPLGVSVLVAHVSLHAQEEVNTTGVRHMHMNNLNAPRHAE